eukprot:TRINITY_DN66867_c0_g1_i1.p1 TRINITY_DN66867_c0_g1~~TRINITY_DN66867_c0_g1_i1.p1  ORF type:complete len:409 (-),score=51.08 TRINITY_DN66867_c0_g1_i1:47-1273(-)
MLPGTPIPASPDSKSRRFSLAGFHIPTRIAGKFGSPNSTINPLEPPSTRGSPPTPVIKSRKAAASPGTTADFSPTIMPLQHVQPLHLQLQSVDDTTFKKLRSDALASPGFIAAASSPAANSGRSQRAQPQLALSMEPEPRSPTFPHAVPSPHSHCTATPSTSLSSGGPVEVLDCGARDLAREANEAVVSVGSVRFLVPYAILKKDPKSNFRKMLDGEWDDVATDEPDGSYTIAHSPFLFAEILQLLQGRFDLPFTDDATLRRLLAEVEFYGLDELRHKLLQRFPRLACEAIRLDGLYFALNTPIPPQPGQFDHVNPDNFFRAFKFFMNGKVVQYKAKRTWSETKVEVERTGSYVTQPDGGITCVFGREEPCRFEYDNDVLYLHYKERISKVVFEQDEKLYTWLKLPVL